MTTISIDLDDISAALLKSAIKFARESIIDAAEDDEERDVCAEQAKRLEAMEIMIAEKAKAAGLIWAAPDEEA
jgi:hypothetical protein